MTFRIQQVCTFRQKPIHFECNFSLANLWIIVPGIQTQFPVAESETSNNEENLYNLQKEVGSNCFTKSNNILS